MFYKDTYFVKTLNCLQRRTLKIYILCWLLQSLLINSYPLNLFVAVQSCWIPFLMYFLFKIPGRDTLDECGLRYLLAMRLHTCLLTSLPPLYRVQLLHQGILLPVWIFAPLWFNAVVVGVVVFVSEQQVDHVLVAWALHDAWYLHFLCVPFSSAPLCDLCSYSSAKVVVGDVGLRLQ